MRRPPAHEWAVLGEDSDPVPGDPDAMAILGQALRDTADTIRREAGEIQALSSVESWQSNAADRFRGAAGDAVSSLRKAFHRYDVASRAMGTRVQDGSTANWASALEHAQQMAGKALRDAQAADAEHRAAQAQLQQLPPNTPPTDPAATAQHKRQDAAATALSKAKADLQAAKDVRDGAAKATAAAIHRAITHDGLHDSTWDKIDSAVGSALSDTGHFLENVGETALSDLASLGNAMVHDLPAVGEVAGGLGLAALGAGGEVGGIALDATGIGAVLGVPAAAVSAGAITGGAALAGAGIDKLANDAAGQYRVNMTSDGSGGGGDWAASAEDGYTHPSNSLDPNATPGGRPASTSPKDDETTIRAKGRENESANILARSGYDVEQNPTVPGDKNPDYRIEGKVFDNYAPTSEKPRNIAKEMQKKVDKGQTDRIVLNLSDSSVDPGQLSAQLHDWPINGLKEVILIDGQGNVLHFYP